MPDPKPSPWTEPRINFDVAQLRLYFIMRNWRDGFASQSDLLNALAIAERCEDLWLAALKPTPEPAPLSPIIIELPF